MEVEWVKLDAVRLRTVMSVETSSYYLAWIDMRPDREARLVEIVRGVVSEFRAALMANPLNSLDPDTDMLPLPCVRYAETLAIGALHREMDRPMSEAEQSRQIRAEIMLRTFYARGFLVAPESGSAGIGRPTYRPGGRVEGIGTRTTEGA